MIDVNMFDVASARHDESNGAIWTTLSEERPDRTVPRGITLFFESIQARGEFWAGVAASCVTPEENDESPT